jgi:hypothetical protein
MSDDTETHQPYEFSSAFRGESYAWHPSPPPEAPAWMPVLVYCLRNELPRVNLESADGRRWSVTWTSKSRQQVRGGSLQVRPLPSRPSEPTPSLESTSILSTAVALLTGTRPHTLTRELWLAASDPDSDLARTLDAIGHAPPTLAVDVDDTDDPNDPSRFDKLTASGDFVILAPTTTSPSAAGHLFLQWAAGEGWLFERIGSSRDSPAAWLAPDIQADTLSNLEQLVGLAAKPVQGKAAEAAVALIADLAQRWTGAAPKWEVRVEPQEREPIVDICTGLVRLPAESRRWRQLAARVGSKPVPQELPSRSAPTSAKRRAVWAGALALAFVLVGLLGFWLGYMHAMNVVREQNEQVEPIDESDSPNE